MDSIRRVNITSDEELFWWLSNKPYRQFLFYFQYESPVLGLTQGEFECYCSRDAGIYKGVYTETYSREKRYYIEFALVGGLQLRTKEELATGLIKSKVYYTDGTSNVAIDIISSRVIALIPMGKDDSSFTDNYYAWFYSDYSVSENFNSNLICTNAKKVKVVYI